MNLHPRHRQADSLIPVTGESQRHTFPMSRLRRMDTRHAAIAKAARRNSGRLTEALQ